MTTVISCLTFSGISTGESGDISSRHDHRAAKVPIALHILLSRREDAVSGCQGQLDVEVYI